MPNIIRTQYISRCIFKIKASTALSEYNFNPGRNMEMHVERVTILQGRQSPDFYKQGFILPAHTWKRFISYINHIKREKKINCFEKLDKSYN